MMDMFNLMKQAQQLQSKMAEMQNGLAALQVEGTAGGGLVSLTLTGKGVLVGMSVDPSLMKPEEAEILEDLIVAAHADAKRKSEEAVKEKMSELTGGMPLPPGLTPFV